MTTSSKQEFPLLASQTHRRKTGNFLTKALRRHHINFRYPRPGMQFADLVLPVVVVILVVLEPGQIVAQDGPVARGQTLIIR
jgi:hypothetical protein